MLYSSLITFVENLSSHIKLSFQLKDDIVLLNSLIDPEKRGTINKIVVSPVNIERETGAGIKFNYQNVATTQYKKSLPTWHINVYMLIAAVFNEKQYEEGIQLLSAVLRYIQSNGSLVDRNTNEALFVEPVNLSFSELSNLWSICGSNYYPSILCKMRIIHIDGNEINRIDRLVEKEILR